MNDCLFCKIAAGDVPAATVHDDDAVMAFRDINPQAPTHILVIPREHIDSAAAVGTAQHPLWGRLLEVAQGVAVDEGLEEHGWRLVTNVGEHGGQTVGHLHLHLLGGRAMTWPPG